MSFALAAIKSAGALKTLVPVAVTAAAAAYGYHSWNEVANKLHLEKLDDKKYHYILCHIYNKRLTYLLIEYEKSLKKLIQMEVVI